MPLLRVLQAVMQPVLQTVFVGIASAGGLFNLLLEDGGDLLLEDGEKLLLE